MSRAKLHGVKATQTDVKQPNYSLVSIRSDGDDEDCEPEYIGCCEWCGEDIYEADEWYETSDGNICCCEDCHDSYETALAEDEEEDCEEDEEE